jgi:hypothetical protein
MDYLTKAQLLQRGWSEKLIREFLRKPDRIRINPFYRSAAPVQLYDRSRVERVESSADYRQARLKTERRKANAHKAVQTKRQKMQKLGRRPLGARAASSCDGRPGTPV